MRYLSSIAAMVVLSSSLICQVFAQEPVKCDFETELGKIYGAAEAKRANLASLQVQVIEQMKKIVDSLPDNNKPIQDQLDKKGLVEFEKVRQRQLVLMNTSLSESKRMRDMVFFRRYVILAEKDVRWPEIYPQDHPDFMPYLMLDSARQIMGDIEVTGETYSHCGLEASIEAMEQDVVDRVNAMPSEPINVLNAVVARLEKKYKVKNVKDAKLNKAEQAELQKAIDNIAPMNALLRLAKDFEILKALVRASQQIYDFDKEDILTYGADADKVGSTLMAKANSGDFGEIFKRAHAVMRVVNNKIPSDDAKDIAKMAKERSDWQPDSK